MYEWIPVLSSLGIMYLIIFAKIKRRIAVKALLVRPFGYTPQTR